MSIGSAVAISGTLGASLIEADHLVVRKVEIWLETIAPSFDGVRIAQLSDLHYTNRHDGQLIGRAVQLANSHAPDIVALTGDYVTKSGRNPRATARNILPCAEILSDLRASSGVFACLGNHDDCDPMFISRSLESRGIAVLRNFAVFVEKGNARLWIAGIEDVLSGRANLNHALQTIPEGASSILLAHEPDFADETRKHSVSLQLSGHSHGGQLRIPIFDSMYLPRLARKYIAGLYRLDNLTLYTNSGIGTLYAPVRLNSSPEVSLITLRAGIRPADGTES